LFFDKPIIAYSIEAAIASKLFDHVIVSTDDDEIAEVAKAYQAEVPFVRPQNISDEFTVINDVMLHAIEWYRRNRGELDYVACIYATCPFLQPHSLRQAYQQLVAEELDYVPGITTFAFPVQRALRLTDQGFIEAMYPEYKLTRSQDLEEAYHDAGQFYIGKANFYGNQQGAKVKPFVLPRHTVQDIDTPEDWQTAELMYRGWTMSKP
jgi:pseudaminic acid cytidylyltransferase